MEKWEYGSDKEQLRVHHFRVRAVGWLWMSDNSTELESNHHKAANKPAEVNKHQGNSSESNKCILVHMLKQSKKMGQWRKILLCLTSAFQLVLSS